MLKGIGSFVGMSLLMLAVGCMAGYIYGWTTWSTYHAVGRAVKAFWLASGVLFISGISYRAFFNKLSSVCGILLALSLCIALVLTGYYYAIGGGWWRGY